MSFKYLMVAIAAAASVSACASTPPPPASIAAPSENVYSITLRNFSPLETAALLAAMENFDGDPQILEWAGSSAAGTLRYQTALNSAALNFALQAALIEEGLQDFEFNISSRRAADGTTSLEVARLVSRRTAR